MAVPYTFATATTSIPLSQLDSNFATAITLGNTSTYLGNTTTSIGNLTLTNATISSGNITISSISDSGNLAFTGTGNRITGDFTNATFANRVAFQTSSANTATTVLALPSGSGTTASWDAYNNSDPTNSGYGALSGLSSETRISSSVRGTGTFLPMTFFTGGSERVRIDTSGNVGVGATANASAILDAQSTTKGVRFPNMTTTQKNAVSSPAAGLVVFDTTLSKLCVYSGAAWQTITSV